MSTDLTVDLDEGGLAFYRRLGNFVQYFQVNLPSNTLGFPLALINPGVLAQESRDATGPDEVAERSLALATWDVVIESGLPTIDGIPIWERLDGEPVTYYEIFKLYREAFYLEGTRSVAKVADLKAIEPRILHVLAKTYHWQLRCKVYDHYKKLLYQRQRELEIQKLETKHSKYADRLLDTAFEYLEEHPQQLNPKIAVQMIQVATKMGRLALGLSPDKPEGESASTHININQAANGGSSASVSVEAGGGNTGSSAEDLSQLQSLLHILDKSGALDRTTVLDADFEVVPDDPK